jgi:outer membrane protein assembly factor BamB
MKLTCKCHLRLSTAMLIAFLLIVSIFGKATTIESFHNADQPTVSVSANAPNAQRSVYLPLVRSASSGPTPPPLSPSEWTQHAHDAQHTDYTDQVVPTPWKWKWAWNGPNSTGGFNKVTTSGTLPKNVQPVTGGGRVYIAAGNDGVYALDNANGSNSSGLGWHRNPGGNINSTLAYDVVNGQAVVFAVSDNGTLYKLDATTGNTLGAFSSTSGVSVLPLPPAVISDRVFFSMGTAVYAVNKSTMQPIWKYDVGSPIQTPPAYSLSRNRVIVGSYDLYVSAINNANVSLAWRTKPTTRTPGDPTGPDAGTVNNYAEFKYGWPVIAESHGLVLARLRLDYSALEVPFGTYLSSAPSTNAGIRTGLTNNPGYQDLFALDLDTGAKMWYGNVTHSGWGDGGNLPMGTQPVVKKYSDGTEVAYVMFRGGANDPSGRQDEDQHFGEMVLDNTTIPGLQAGDVRWIQYGGGPYNWNSDVSYNQPRDEEPFITMSGNNLLGVHWGIGMTLQVTNRSATYGSYSNPIRSSPIPGYVLSIVSGVQGQSIPCSSSHWYPNPFAYNDNNQWKTIAQGFYLYCNSSGGGAGYNRNFGSWIVSNNTVYISSNESSVVALENGNPTAQSPIRLVASTDLNAENTGWVNNPHADNRPATGPAVISYLDARQHIGEGKTVEGTIQQILNNEHAVYLGFKDPHQGELVVRIMKADWGNFDGVPNTLYRLGETIRVTGKIEWYEGDPVIYVNDPTQIHVIP